MTHKTLIKLSFKWRSLQPVKHMGLNLIQQKRSVVNPYRPHFNSCLITICCDEEKRYITVLNWNLFSVLIYLRAAMRIHWFHHYRRSRRRHNRFHCCRRRRRHQLKGDAATVYCTPFLSLSCSLWGLRWVTRTKKTPVSSSQWEIDRTSHHLHPTHRPCRTYSLWMRRQRRYQERQTEIIIYTIIHNHNIDQGLCVCVYM